MTAKRYIVLSTVPDIQFRFGEWYHDVSIHSLTFYCTVQWESLAEGKFGEYV